MTFLLHSGSILQTQYKTQVNGFSVTDGGQRHEIHDATAGGGQRHTKRHTTTLQRHFSDTSATLQRHFSDTSATLRRHFDDILVIPLVLVTFSEFRPSYHHSIQFCVAVIVLVGFNRFSLDLRGIDHSIAWSTGGLTIPANGQPCCWFLLFLLLLVGFRSFVLSFSHWLFRRLTLCVFHHSF